MDARLHGPLMALAPWPPDQLGEDGAGINIHVLQKTLWQGPGWSSPLEDNRDVAI